MGDETNTGKKCCCEKHGVMGDNEWGHSTGEEVPNYHGTMYVPGLSEGMEESIWPRKTACPSCPIHGIAKKER
jgi:hypothetical protein